MDSYLAILKRNPTSTYLAQRTHEVPKLSFPINVFIHLEVSISPKKLPEIPRSPPTRFRLAEGVSIPSPIAWYRGCRDLSLNHN